MTSGLGSPEALQSFVEETRARLRTLRPLRFLRPAGSGALDLEAVHHVFRQIHSLKSASNLLGLSSIEQLCHRFEDVLAGYRDGEMTPGEQSEAELEPTLETIERLVDNIRIIRALDVSHELARLARVAESRRPRGGEAARLRPDGTHHQQEGKVMVKNAPYIVTLEPGTYHWCSCGKSAKAPFCDGSHKGTGKEPVEFVQQKKGPAALCGCGRTLKPPFCDGSHARKE